MKPDNIWVKDPTGFTILEFSLEPELAQQYGFLTPNERFFVCNDAGTPIIDEATYQLRIVGDAISQPLRLTYADLLSLPSRTVLAYLECAGSQRSLYQKVLGREVGEVQWTLGGVGMAEWTGVPLRYVLEMAGLRPNALDVNLIGLDEDATEGGVQRPIPINKALDLDTILAYSMNGELLPYDHGFPLRAIVPGWVGTNSVKWLGTIEVSSEKIWVSRNTKQYVLIGPEWPPDEDSLAEGAPISTLNIKSSLALPWPAHLESGLQVVRGFARSPHAKIAKVEWRSDNERKWKTATLIPPILKYSWVRFELTWEAQPGEHSLQTRATDEAGNTQPASHPINERGYMFNMVHPHPVNVE